MEQIISSVVAVIEQAVQSGFLVYFVLVAMLIIATIGVFGSWRRFAGYALGWLVTIFVAFIFTKTQGELAPSDGSLISSAAPVDMIILGIPSCIGLFIGFILLFIFTKIGDDEGGQSIIVAVVTGSAGIMLFFMSVTPAPIRSLVGTFAIAFAIGCLAYIVLRGVNIREKYNERELRVLAARRRERLDELDN